MGGSPTASAVVGPLRRHGFDGRWAAPCIYFNCWKATKAPIGIVSNVKAVLLVRTRIVYDEGAFADLVLWRLGKPVEGSHHEFKYRLAYVVRGVCVIRYDNELGKGDHRHFGSVESIYRFTTPDRLVVDFQRDILRWNDENRHS